MSVGKLGGVFEDRPGLHLEAENAPSRASTSSSASTFTPTGLMGGGDGVLCTLKKCCRSRIVTVNRFAGLTLGSCMGFFEV